MAQQQSSDHVAGQPGKSSKQPLANNHLAALAVLHPSDVSTYMPAAEYFLGAPVSLISNTRPSETVSRPTTAVQCSKGVQHMANSSGCIWGSNRRLVHL